MMRVGNMDIYMSYVSPFFCKKKLRRVFHDNLM